MGNFTVIIGEDDYLAEECVRTELDPAADLEIIDSSGSSNEESQLRDIAAADASFSTPPFLTPVKATWWKNVGFLPAGGRSGGGEKVRHAIENAVKKWSAAPLPDNQRFYLTAPRLLATSIVAKTLGKFAEIRRLDAPKPWERVRDAQARVESWAQGMQLEFAPGAAAAFVARVGVDSRTLHCELEKMRDYLGDSVRKITAADVAEVSSSGPGTEPEVWSVTDALGERDVRAALAAAARFERENGYAVMISTVVERFFRQLAELKDAVASDCAGDIAATMPPFAFRKQTGFLRHWTLNELQRARARFLALREKAVTSSGGVDALVAVEIVRACRPAAIRKGVAS